MVADKKKIVLLGAGTMGAGIIQTFAQAGHEVKLIYVYDDKARTRPGEAMEVNLNILREEGVQDGGTIPAILDRVSQTESLEEAAVFADVTIECTVEDLAAKQDYSQKLDALCPLLTVLTTNTSAISVTRIIGKAVHKERIIGTHFWSPAYLVPLVEVVRTKYVSEETMTAVFQLMEEVDKGPVLVKKNVPGFLANWMQRMLFHGVISIVENGITEAEDVGDAIKYGFGMRLGVSGSMETIDRGGPDLTYSIHKYLFSHTESSAGSSKLTVQLMDKEKLGFRAGEDFQLWSFRQVKVFNETLIRGLIRVSRALDRLQWPERQRRGISLGYPADITGPRTVITLPCELRSRGLRCGLPSCAGVIGTAVVIENLDQKKGNRMTTTRRLNDSSKAIATTALTDAVTTKQDNSYLPTQSKEIIEAALRYHETGAAMVYIYVRDDSDARNMRFDRFEEAVGLIRVTDCLMLLSSTSSGGQGFSWEERTRPFRELRSEMASFDTGTMNWLHSVAFVSEPKSLELCGQEMRAIGVKPEIEAFDMGMLNTAKHCLRTGVLDAPVHFQLYLGAPSGIEATTENLVHLANYLPKNCTWSTFGIDRSANKITPIALAVGDNIRVGLEGNICCDKGILAQGSQWLIGQVKQVAAGFGRALTTPGRTCAILGLK